MKARFADIVKIVNGRNQRHVENPNGIYPIYGSGGVIGYADDYICDEHAVVIGRKGSINNPIFVDKKFWNVDTAFGLIANKDIILPKYLYYFCKKYNFNSLNTTVTIPSLTKANLLDIAIEIPSLKKQSKIVDILDKIHKVIATQRERIDLIALLIKSQFIEMFGDPVTNPMGWEKVSLDKLGELNRGVSKHRPRNAPELLGGEYPLIQTGEVAGSGLYITEHSATYSETGLKQSKMWPKGTLCITIAANIAKTGILGFDACFPDSIVGFTSGIRTNQLFVYFLFVFFQKILEEQAPESAQKNINLQTLKELQVICPPLPLQNQFAAFVEQADKSKFAGQLTLVCKTIANQYIATRPRKGLYTPDSQFLINDFGVFHADAHI